MNADTAPDPHRRPELDEAFQPVVLADRRFLAEAARSRAAAPLVVALERPDGTLTRCETRVVGASDPHFPAALAYAERLIARLLWQRGGARIHVGGPAAIGAHAARLWGAEGERAFDRELLGERVFGTPLTVVAGAPEDVPPANDPPRAVGGHRDGCRIGFDLGASDRKVAAVREGEVVFQEETVWDPASASDPAYHEREIEAMLRRAAEHLPRVDAIGGSAAGIYVGGEPRVATLFRGVPAGDFERVRTLFTRLRERWGVPLEVVNDGDVTALAGSLGSGRDALLGLALGSSLAGGFVAHGGALTSWLNELAFCVLDDAPTAPRDDWSGARGTAAEYLSQRAVFRLAARAGLPVPADAPNAEKLAGLQAHLVAGDPRAVSVWRSVGTYLGYAIALFAELYPLRTVLLLGRCTSGVAGTLLVDEARTVLATEFPAPAAAIELSLPDDTTRRLGQAVAAASLPAIP